MSDLRQAAQQALEALEAGPDVDPIFAGETEAALRAALAQQAEPLNKCHKRRNDPCACSRKAMLCDGFGPPQQAEPVQEPVAWRYKAMIGMPWSLSDDGYYISCKRDQRYFVEALYTTPPQRPPLTDEEISDIYIDWDITPGRRIADLVRAIERKVRGE